MFRLLRSLDYSSNSPSLTSSAIADAQTLDRSFLGSGLEVAFETSSPLSSLSPSSSFFLSVHPQDPLVARILELHNEMASSTSPWIVSLLQLSLPGATTDKLHVKPFLERYKQMLYVSCIQSLGCSQRQEQRNSRIDQIADERSTKVLLALRYGASR